MQADDRISISLVEDSRDPTVAIAGTGGGLLRLANLLIDLGASSSGQFLNPLSWVVVKGDLRVWIDCAERDQGMVEVTAGEGREFVWRLSPDHAMAFSAHLDDLANSDCGDPHFLEAGHDQFAVMVSKRESEDLRA